MKKRIRLTEEDLRGIIIEAINELDWKTYANAARANDKKYFNDVDYMSNKKGYKRSEEFSAAAKQAFDDKYGVKHTSREDSKEYEYGFDPNYVSRVPGSIYKVTSHIPDSDAKEVSDLEYDGEYYDDGYFSPFYNNNNLHKERPEYFDKHVPWAVDRMKSGDDDISKFANGDYEYQKGKGWVANESVSKIDKIVKESVRKILSENENPKTKGYFYVLYKAFPEFSYSFPNGYSHTGNKYELAFESDLFNTPEKAMEEGTKDAKNRKGFYKGLVCFYDGEVGYPVGNEEDDDEWTFFDGEEDWPEYPTKD